MNENPNDKPILTEDAFAGGFLNKKLAGKVIDRLWRPMRVIMPAPFSDAKVLDAELNFAIDLSSCCSSKNFDAWESGTLTTYAVLVAKQHA